MLKKITSISLASLACLAANAQSLSLTSNVPACKSPAGEALPQAYLAMARVKKDFAWVKAAKTSDAVVGGNGFERFDGSNLHDWFQFQRVDLNNDGLCDWFVTMQAPDSSGGDHDSINTLYLGQASSWQRLGAAIPKGQVDTLGVGRTMEEQATWFFGEEMAVVHDSGANLNYLILWLGERAVQRTLYPGYRVFAWDKTRSTLALLDKWQSGSPAAGVYAYFKARGGWSPSQAAPVPFDPTIESFEIEAICSAIDASSAPAGAAGTLPPGLAARCPH